MSDQDIRTIRYALADEERAASNRIENSYGKRDGDVTRDMLKPRLSQIRKALKALDRLDALIRNRLHGLPEVEHEPECICHLIGETCQVCNERYEAEEADNG